MVRNSVNVKLQHEVSLPVQILTIIIKPLWFASPLQEIAINSIPKVVGIHWKGSSVHVHFKPTFCGIEHLIMATLLTRWVKCYECLCSIESVQIWHGTVNRSAHTFMSNTVPSMWYVRPHILAFRAHTYSSEWSSVCKHFTIHMYYNVLMVLIQFSFCEYNNVIYISLLCLHIQRSCLIVPCMHFSCRCFHIHLLR